MTALLALIAAATAPVPSDVPPANDPPVANDPLQQRAEDIVVVGQATEGTDDYAVKAQTSATRLAVSQRETPQSLSVVTRAQIQDFQLNDVNSLLTTVPGVTVQAQETDRIYYSARGFDIQTFQIDGIGLPFAFGIQTGSIDTAIYDRVEVVRGAPGLLSSTGNPSAVINFIRKRPTREFQISASAQYGSFDNIRLDGDVSVPLTSDGSVRARAVGALLDTDSYLDRYSLRRWTGYGIVEADLGPNTVVSAGYGHQDHRSRGAMWGALPIYYTDGTRIDLDRSTNTGPEWSGWNVTDRQIFGDITHSLGDGWTAKVSLLRRVVSEDDELFYVYGNPDRATGLGIFSYPGAFRGETKNLTIDAYLEGKVQAFGRSHDVMFGINRGAQQYDQYSSYDTAQIGVSLPLATVFDGSFPRPTFPTPYDYSLDTHSRRETAYGLVRLNLADPLKVMVGGNYTRSTSEGVSYGTPQNFRVSRFLPFVGATYDLSANVSAYASFATIFNPQTELSASNAILPPIEGDNLEAGLKGEWNGGRLNASIAVFQARQNNTAFGQFNPALGRTVFTPTDAKSQGVELDFGGELLPGLHATGGYTLMRVEDQQGDPARTFVPRNTGRLNVTYRPPTLPALKLGTSIQYQSRFYFEPTDVRSTTTGQQVRITQGGYALVDLLARYELTERVAVSANLRNVTNAKYLTALNYDQSYYGAPRSILGTISVRY
ncbi:TonB-dependent siderophore receptor [Sphingomonas sp. RS2018]